MLQEQASVSLTLPDVEYLLYMAIDLELFCSIIEPLFSGNAAAADVGGCNKDGGAVSN